MAKKRFGTDIRQEQIAESALSIVRAEGIRALSVAAVAKHVGIVPSAIYRHFNNKGDIVSAVLQLIKKRLNAHFQETAQLNIDPIEKLRLLLNRHVGLISQNNAIPRIIFSEEVLGGMPEKRQHLYGIIQDVIGNVATIVADGQKQGTIRNDIPADSIAVSFLGMIQPAAIIWNLSDGAFDLKRHSEKAWNLFADAIRHLG